MRIVITGGAGFLGSHLSETLVARGHEVVAVDNLVTGRRANVTQLEASGRFELIEHDVTEPFDVDGDVDGILHFASAASPVPGEVFGLPKGSKLADRYYTNDRTVWVEPETGVMMKLQEKQHQTLEVANAKPVDAMLTTSTMTDETIKKNVDDYNTKSSQLKILRLWAPLLLGLLGLFALLLGLLVSLRAGRERRAARHERRDEREVDDVRHDDDSTLVFGDHSHSRGAHSADERGQY